MQDGPRILVAAALGKIIEPLLQQSLPDAMVRIAADQAAVERAVSDRLRFDVVVADLTCYDHVVLPPFTSHRIADALGTFDV
jgi:hypothetical protein